MSNIQIRAGSTLVNTTLHLLQNSIPSVSRSKTLNNIIVSQRRNKSTNLDKDFAQNLFFSQHRPIIFNDLSFALENHLQNETKSVVEPIPFSNTIPKCKSYGEMKYINQEISEFEKNEEEKNQILTAWEILDCMFTGHSNNNPKEEETIISNQNNTPQPLKSISEDTILSCVNNSLYPQQEEDDIDIDILFHQLFKDSSSNSSNSSSSNSSSNPLNSNDSSIKK